MVVLVWVVRLVTLKLLKLKTRRRTREGLNSNAAKKETSIFLVYSSKSFYLLALSAAFIFTRLLSCSGNIFNWTFLRSLSLLLIRTIRACRYRTLLITCVGVSCTDNSVFLSFLNINDRGRLKVYYNVPITKSTHILVIVILVSLCQKDINRPSADDVIAKCLNIEILVTPTRWVELRARGL